MEPVTTSTTLATIVGLICNYKQERGAKKDSDHRNFIEWLEYHRHEEIKNLITNTQALQDEVNQLLREEHSEILQKLNSINNVLSQVLSRVSGFEVLTQEFGSGLVLSDQAYLILHQFADSESEELLCFQNWLGMSDLRLVTPPGDIVIKRNRFIRDDIYVLETLGFIRPTRDYDGGHELLHTDGPGVYYCLTRSGEEYVRIVEQRKHKRSL